MKYKLGNVEIIATVVGIIGFVIVSMLFGVPDFKSVPSVTTYACVLWLTLVAAIYGPYTGLMTGVIGTGLARVVFGNSIVYVGMIIMGMYGFLIGRGAEKFLIRDGGFAVKIAIDFNAFQVMSNIIIWVFFMPFLEFMIYDENIMQNLHEGITIMIISTILTFFVGTGILLLINEFVRLYLSRKQH